CPVPAAREVLAASEDKETAELAENPLIFPDEDGAIAVNSVPTGIVRRATRALTPTAGGPRARGDRPAPPWPGSGRASGPRVGGDRPYGQVFTPNDRMQPSRWRGWFAKLLAGELPGSVDSAAAGIVRA
ncbi:hypothetical protein ACWDA9_41565, partial [Streptomyces sp. NPDC001193]